LDRFIDELKDTESYCDYYKAEIEEAGVFNCDYFKRLPYYYRRYPIKTCHGCGEYVRDYNDELYDENIICGKCRWK
jgi:formylmethanofuran dehydrogenase subunit E